MEIKLDVFCSTCSFDGVPDAATVDLETSLQKRILQLSEAAKKYDVYTLREFEDSPLFFDEDNKIVCAMDYVILNVAKSYFFWSGRTKHTCIEIETGPTEIADLEISSSEQVIVNHNIKKPHLQKRAS